MQNKAQSQAKRTRQSYISRREKQRGSLGVEPQPPDVNGFGDRAPDAVAVAIILLFFQKTHIFRHTLV